MRWEGWNIGSVTIRRVLMEESGEVSVQSRRHGGDLRGVIREMISKEPDVNCQPVGAAVTGPLAATILNLPYIPEPLSIEKAIEALHLKPDMVLSLGGESFVVYCIRSGKVRNMNSSSRCAAGSGEFIIQQLGRMGLDLEHGLDCARGGKHVKLAARCSVHIKSDATHKLNKGECSSADIAYTMCIDLARKIQALIEATAWPNRSILVCGGLSKNEILLEELRRLYPDSQIKTVAESAYLEAFGAAINARSNGHLEKPLIEYLVKDIPRRFEILPPISTALDKVTYVAPKSMQPAQAGMKVLLGIDAGSTTTKAALLDLSSKQVLAACYLRTHGNPVAAVHKCLDEIKRQLSDCPVIIAQTAVTGSGRELVSVAMGNCLSFNEILAHARAAREIHPEVDTIFEIGGQDAKFISLLKGIPVDYAMNDGCSAGTGSFLEDASASDLKCPVEKIGEAALQAETPLAFGERCAAFINSEIRTALQAGENPNDILAGLVYSIVKNYLSRVVGTRHIGSSVLLQGGVALNPAVAPAVSLLSGRQVIVPDTPELMGCFGAALMARDLLDEAKVQECTNLITHFQLQNMEIQNTFRCGSCSNHCEVQRISINKDMFPFGGLCSRWEMQRRPVTLRHPEGKDFIDLRTQIMIETFANVKPEHPRGRMGLPLALSTYELFPFYSKLITELGYEVVLSRPGCGRKNTYASFCYPAELLHAAVDDLLQQGVDWILLPQVREYEIPGQHLHAYSCSFSEDSGGIIRGYFSEQAEKILTPEIGFSPQLEKTSHLEIQRMAKQIGVSSTEARRAYQSALKKQSEFVDAYQAEGKKALLAVKGPLVILVGRPYAAFNTSINLSISRKIASRGFHVIPADMLPLEPSPVERNVWHFTQVATSAIRYANEHEDAYICYLSCYSCNPDAVIYHRIRQDLEGQPFCFLEIDSHTADAGIVTRIGAFLDIIEARRQSGAQNLRILPARPDLGRVEYSNKHPRIITGKGEILGFDHPRVKHILLADTPEITSRLFASLYSRMGWHCETTPYMDMSVLQAARRVCSGRECLPFLAMVGKMMLHLEKRPPDEVTLFHFLEQEGPCQIGNWYDAARIIFQRNQIANAFTVWPRLENNYLGGGEKVAISAAVAGVLGDLMCEVRSALTCLAKDPSQALKCLDTLEDSLVKAAGHGLPAVESTLKRTASELSHIPLERKLSAQPRVLLFSGINRIFVDKPIRRFFEERGIVTKTGDVGEFLCFFETEPIVRRGFALGRKTPDEHFALSTLLSGLLNNPTSEPRFKAVHARVHVWAIEFLDHHWRSIMAPSGLVFAPDIHYRKMLCAGHQSVSLNGWTEAPCTAGRYLMSLDKKAYDGYVNIGAFNCIPASNATAVTHDAAMKSNQPYAVIEADGASITASQFRQLEAVAAQCWEQKIQD